MRTFKNLFFAVRADDFSHFPICCAPRQLFKARVIFQSFNLRHKKKCEPVSSLSLNRLWTASSQIKKKQLTLLTLYVKVYILLRQKRTFLIYSCDMNCPDSLSGIKAKRFPIMSVACSNGTNVRISFYTTFYVSCLFSQK
jgi:hypothetical protein